MDSIVPFISKYLTNKTLRLPRIEKCECGEDFDLDRSEPCVKCKSNYCEDCCKKGKKCVYCKPTAAPKQMKQIIQGANADQKWLVEKMKLNKLPLAMSPSLYRKFKALPEKDQKELMDLYNSF